jgi:MFS family permease
VDGAGLAGFADRAGKGIRTAPRDAMIYLSTPREHLGAAFGVHRALDTTGAMLGPLLAFGILWLVPEGFNSVFVVSFAFAVIGLAILMLFVEQPAGATPKNVEPVRVADALRLFAAVRFRTIVLVGGALAVFTASDGFIYLSLQDRLGFETGFFPLLYVGTAATYMLLAIPAGRLADHFGRGKVFLAGYGLLVLVYALVLAPSFGAGAVVAALLLFGAYYAATDGVLAAFASSVLPTDLRATGLAFLVTVTSIARLGASILFGAIWTAYGVEAALEFFAVSLGVSVIAAAVVLARLRPEAAHA